jgi:hypothetical protein
LIGDAVATADPGDPKIDFRRDRLQDRLASFP